MVVVQAQHAGSLAYRALTPAGFARCAYNPGASPGIAKALASVFCMPFSSIRPHLFSIARLSKPASFRSLAGRAVVIDATLGTAFLGSHRPIIAGGAAPATPGDIAGPGAGGAPGFSPGAIKPFAPAFMPAEPC